MQKVAVLAVFLCCSSLFAGYKVVFRNGAVVELKAMPDLTGRMVEGETLDGKRIIVPVRIIDLEATRAYNQTAEVQRPAVAQEVPVKPEKPAEQVPVHPVRENPELVERPATEAGRTPSKPFVITEETVGKPEPKEQPSAESAREAALARTNTNVREEPMSEETEGGEIRDSSGRTESYWQGRFEANRSQTRATEEQVEKVQDELNRLFTLQLSTDDDIYKRRIDQDIQKLTELMDRLRKQLTSLQKEKADLLDEARRSGALPGWYRDYDD